MTINGGGYTFINPLDVSQPGSLDVAAIFTDTSNFLLVMNQVDGTQWYGTLTQLAIYA
jgi:hypothetical protein